MSSNPPGTAALWWHAYGAAVDGMWVMMIAGEATKPPGEWLANPLPYGESSLPHIASWDHEPTAAEKDAVTPERFRDDD